jgi:hypothetical protein
MMLLWNSGFRRLANAIQCVVRSQPHDRQTINQSMYTPLLDWPIGISIETKADGVNEEWQSQGKARHAQKVQGRTGLQEVRNL